MTIQDGTYNVDWMIAGFDMEAGRVAADGTTYNNGYGICFVSKTQVTTERWNTENTVTGGYKSSYMHNTVLPNIVTKLRNVLGSHIVNRNVLLSSSTDGTYSNAYTWTTAYATLMSVGQMTGTFAASSNMYDDGEANYKLPVFNFMGYGAGSYVWARGIYGSYNTVYLAPPNGGGFSNSNTDVMRGVRPLIYLR